MPGLHWIHVSTGEASSLISSPHFKATRGPRTHAEAQRSHCQVGLSSPLGKKAVGCGVFSFPTALYYFQCHSLTILATRSGIQSEILVLFSRALCKWQSPNHTAHFYSPLFSALFSKKRTEPTTHAEAIKSRQRRDASGTRYSTSKRKEIPSPWSPKYFSPKMPKSQVAGLFCNPDVSQSLPNKTYLSLPPSSPH